MNAAEALKEEWDRAFARLLGELQGFTYLEPKTMTDLQFMGDQLRHSVEVLIAAKPCQVAYNQSMRRELELNTSPNITIQELHDIATARRFGT